MHHCMQCTVGRMFLLGLFCITRRYSFVPHSFLPVLGYASSLPTQSHQPHAYMHLGTALLSLADCLKVTTLEQRCQKLESEVQKLAQTWSEAAPAEEIKVSSFARM